MEDQVPCELIVPRHRSLLEHQWTPVNMAKFSSNKNPKPKTDCIMKRVDTLAPKKPWYETIQNIKTSSGFCEVFSSRKLRMNSLRSRRAWNRNVGYQLFPDYTDMGSIWDHLERLKVQQWYTKTGLLPIQLFFSTLLEEPQLQQKQTQKGKKYKDFGMLMKLKRQCLQMAEVKSDSWSTPERSNRWSGNFRITWNFAVASLNKAFRAI